MCRKIIFLQVKQGGNAAKTKKKKAQPTVQFLNLKFLLVDITEQTTDAKMFDQNKLVNERQQNKALCVVTMYLLSYDKLALYI